MAVLVSDSFNRANGSLGSTDSYNGGTSLPWQTNTANFIISSNKGTVNALDDTQFAYVDCGQSDVIISMDFSQTSTLGNCPKLFFRGTNFTNAYLTYWTGAGWQLYKLVNGILTNLASSTSVGGPTSTNVVNVKVECNGTTLKWYLNGTLIATITDSTFNGTKHGWGTQRVQGLADNFVIESLGTGTTYTDGSTTFDTKQSIYQDNSTNFDTKQTIYNDSSTISDTKQVIYSDSSVSFDTQQVIQTGGIDGSVSFDTKQTLYSDSSVSFDTKQGLYSDSQVVFNTKQACYNDGFVSFDTLQVIEKIDWVDGSVSFDTQQLITETPKVVAQEINLTFIAENEVNLSSEMENSVSLSFTI